MAFCVRKTTFLCTGHQHSAQERETSPTTLSAAAEEASE
jgi:hypothetical protein